MELEMTSMVLIWTILFVFLFYEPDARMTNQFEEFRHELDQCSWYLLPIEIQRMYAILLSDAQRPVYLFSFGHIKCDRETLKKVLTKLKISLEISV